MNLESWWIEDWWEVRTTTNERTEWFERLEQTMIWEDNWLIWFEWLWRGAEDCKIESIWSDFMILTYYTKSDPILSDLFFWLVKSYDFRSQIVILTLLHIMHWLTCAWNFIYDARPGSVKYFFRVKKRKKKVKGLCLNCKPKKNVHHRSVSNKPFIELNWF